MFNGEVRSEVEGIDVRQWAGSTAVTEVGITVVKRMMSCKLYTTTSHLTGLY